MRAKVLMSGMPMTYEECVISMVNFDFEHEIFSHFWWNDDYIGRPFKLHFSEKFPNQSIEEIVKKLNISSFKIEKSKKFDLGFLKNFDSRIWEQDLNFYKLMTPIVLQGLISQCYSVYNAYILDENKSYDLVIKTRPDIIHSIKLNDIIDRLDLSDNKIYFQSSMGGGHLYAGEHPKKPCDWFFLGSDKVISEFLSAWYKSIPFEFSNGVIHTSDYIKLLCKKLDIELHLVDFGAHIYKQTNAYYDKYLVDFNIYLNDFDFDKLEPRNHDIWPYWIDKVDFQSSKNFFFL